VEPNCADPSDGTKCTPESVPDLRTEDPAVEPYPPEQGEVNASGAHVPDTLVDTAVNMESTANAEGDPSCTDGVMKTNLIDEEGEASDSSIDDHQPATSEVDFNVSRLIYSKSNSYRTNHYIICMLRRFCEDLELSPMLYQVKETPTYVSSHLFILWELIILSFAAITFNYFL
jgi:timeless